jgi:hypothetical protein
MSSTWRCLILASTHRVGGSGPPGEVGGEAHHENESSREARRAELQEFLVTSSSSDEGGDEEGEQGKRYQEAFSRVEFDAKCMGAKFLSAVKG